MTKTNSDGYKFGGVAVDINTFAESDDCLAIYNIAPIVPGHVLVVPKKTVVSVNDLSEDELLSFFTFARRVTKFITDEFKTTGFDWTIQDGLSAGQTVPHLHLHIIPRIEGDFEKPGDWYPALKHSTEENIDSEKRGKLSEKEVKELTLKLKKSWTKNKKH